jgi:predicted dienelactone hydrolase
MRHRTVLAILAVFCAAFSTLPTTSAADDKTTVGYLTLTVPVSSAEGIPCAVWYPGAGGATRAVYDLGRSSRVGDSYTDARPSPGRTPYPLVIYSHGYSGCSAASAYLCESLAAEGFIVAAPDHSDDLKICSLAPGYDPKSFIGFRILFSAVRLADRLAVGNYDIEEFRYRFVQIKATIDYLLAQGRDDRSPFCGLIDGEHVGAVGHSLGGFSVMIAAGARDVGIDFGIDAVVSLSGPGGNAFPCSDMGKVTIPVMLMYGTKEEGSREKGSGILKQYRCLAGPKFLMGVVGADHLSFSERLSYDPPDGGAPARRIDEHHRLISRRTVSFFRFYLSHIRDAADALAENDPGLVPFYRSF